VDVTVACAPFLESGQWIRLGGRRRLRLHCAADPLEHHSTDTFPAARSGKKCQFCSKKDLNSSELQMLSYTPRRSISQFIWIWPSPTLLGLHAALLSELPVPASKLHVGLLAILNVDAIDEIILL
jgi:hypothetical protein